MASFYGIVSLSQGVAAFIGAPLAGISFFLFQPHRVTGSLLIINKPLCHKRENTENQSLEDS